MDSVDFHSDCIPKKILDQSILERICNLGFGGTSKLTDIIKKRFNNCIVESK
jgi:hypothetical protein